jgi:phosphohistidine phosphatase
VINRLKESWERVFIVGHNPSMSYLAEYITHAEIGSIVPGGYVHIKVKLKKWELLSEGNGDFIASKDPLTYDF